MPKKKDQDPKTVKFDRLVELIADIMRAALHEIHQQVFLELPW